MAEPVSHPWSPIEDLPPNSRQLARPDTAAIVSAWHHYASRLKQRQSYVRFLAQLRRQWAIETGILERLYTLDEGATKTLIEKGLDEALISHNDTDLPPRQVIAMIRDQQTAIEGLYQFISGNRPLGTSYIKELHVVLTDNQRRYEALDTLGNRVERDLPRGEWKRIPNNVEGPDGFHFQFCPPEHVASEMDRLLTLHAQHEADGIPPDVEAAWLHHRFTLIHPFTDGNGRVARCLATLVLLKAEWFPLVVLRTDRANYIAALRAADAGDLSKLVELFGELQNRTILQALSITDDSETHTRNIQGILQAVKEKLATPESIHGEFAKLAATATALANLAAARLREVALDIHTTTNQMAQETNSWDNLPTNIHYFDPLVLQLAQQQIYLPTFEPYSTWCSLTIRSTFTTEIVLSFHAVGKDTGVLACLPFAFARNSELAASPTRDTNALSTEPFLITPTEEPTAMTQRFKPWLEAVIVHGLTYWRKSIGA